MHKIVLRGAFFSNRTLRCYSLQVPFRFREELCEFFVGHLMTPFVMNPCQPHPPVGFPSFSAMQLIDGVMVGRSMLPSQLQMLSLSSAGRGTCVGPRKTAHRFALGHTNMMCAVASGYPSIFESVISKDPTGSSSGHSSLGSRTMLPCSVDAFSSVMTDSSA